MSSIVYKPLCATTSLWFVGLCAISTALAGPPSGKVQAFGRPLDLRPPPAVESAEKAPMLFPSLQHRQMLGAQEPLQLPSLGSDGMQSRNRVEEFVRRVHQEGLPVARLIESKSALVHLGFNPRGKPGLWLVQKIH
jgi:hypothetical protein